jgi:D-3-phosphoglycerate dehydrogenase
LIRNVLIAAPVHPVLTAGLEAVGYTLIIWEKITRAEALAVVPGCVGIITSTRLQLDKELIDTAPLLGWIGRMGSGMEVIDVPYARSKGIRCVGSPEGNCNAVAEHTLGLLLGLTKRIHWSAGEVAAGQWLRDENRGMELEGKTIGIIGFGHTGRAFAVKLQGFGMEVLAYDKQPQALAPDYVQLCNNLDLIYERANIISFHVPIDKDTRNYLNYDFLSRMHQRFILINTSRGEVVPSEVLKNGLNSGKILGAGLDVWPEEPLDKMGKKERAILDTIVKLPQVIITPHIAGYSYEAVYKMSKVLLGKLITK